MERPSADPDGGLVAALALAVLSYIPHALTIGMAAMLETLAMAVWENRQKIKRESRPQRRMRERPWPPQA